MHILGYPSGFLFDKTLDQGQGGNLPSSRCAVLSHGGSNLISTCMFSSIYPHSGGSLPLSCRETFVVA